MTHDKRRLPGAPGRGMLPRVNIILLISDTFHFDNLLRLPVEAAALFQ